MKTRKNIKTVVLILNGPIPREFTNKEIREVVTFTTVIYFVEKYIQAMNHMITTATANVEGNRMHEIANRSRTRNKKIVENFCENYDIAEKEAYKIISVEFIDDDLNQKSLISAILFRL